MPWTIAKDARIKLGGNYFVNCEHLITFDDESLIVVKRRDNDGQLGVDFNIYGKDGQRIGVIRHGRVVEGHDDYLIEHGPDRKRIIEKTNGKVICEIDRSPSDDQAELAVTLSTYLPNGFRLEVSPDAINISKCTMQGCSFSNLIVGIAIGRSTQRGVGIALDPPSVD